MSTSSKDVEQGPSPVRVEATSVASGLASHLSIVVTNKDGSETGYRGGPTRQGNPTASTSPADQSDAESFGPIRTLKAPYRSGYVDYSPDAPKVTVDIGGQDVETVSKCFDKVMGDIERAKVTYNPLGPNSNSFVGTMLSRCGCQQVKPVWVAPGFTTDLLKKSEDDGKKK